MHTTFTVIASTERLTHVEITGALDVQHTREIELKFTATTAGRHKPVIIDISKVDFIASSGIGLLVQVARTLSLDKHPTILLAPNETIAHTIRIAKLDSMLQIASNLEAATALAQLPSLTSERLR